MANEKRKLSSFNLFLIIQLIIMMILSAGISAAISVKTQNISAEHMATLAMERSQIIKNYIDNAERTLSEYSHADQIMQVLQNPDNSACVQAAQNYTDAFSKDIDNLEGIYVSKWTTEVLAHTNPDTKGKVIRTMDGIGNKSLDALQKALLQAGDSVYNTGIIISPVSKNQIVSLYKAIYRNGEPIGLVGMGVCTNNLVETLDLLSANGNENFKYNMIDVSTHKYIFSNERDVLTTDSNGDLTAVSVSGKTLNQLCTELGNKKPASNYSGIFKSSDTGEKSISTYLYMKESYMGNGGWIFTITQPQKEYYSLTQTLLIYLIVFALFCIIILIIFSFINKKQEETNVKLNSVEKKNAKTKESLNTALFNDILTDVNNRVSFSTDFGDGKIKDAPNYPYYFALFNISGFSDININYGTEVGDSVLVNTASSLKKVFTGGTVYRTGSDEFVVAIQSQNTEEGFSDIKNKMNSAVGFLTAPLKTENGVVKINYTTALVKKSKNINAGVITALKDIANRNGITQSGQINYIDLDGQH